ncbi:MAG: hypothetical protein KAS73_08600 [Candidatus Sabulitectum sp.]|nr:hypothetical protein [Candidatus Sabulitectum sp.]
MKMFILAIMTVLVLAVACGGVATPEQVVKKLFDALKNSDGDSIAACMSEEALEGVSENLEEMKKDPVECVAFFAAMNIEISRDDVQNITAGDLISVILESEVFTTEMSDLNSIETGETTIHGDNAIVLVIIEGYEKEFELVLENGYWKIDDGLGFL